MNRRELLQSGLGSALGLAASGRGGAAVKAKTLGELRSLFPRLEQEVFLNAAAGAPLSRAAEAGLERYFDVWRSGSGEDRGQRLWEAVDGARSRFAGLIGADVGEIGLVHCTKAGEQIVIDGLRPRLERGNIVTNDLHFSGSLHNLVGLRRSGIDVRIVRSDSWRVPLELMAAAIDDRTELVTVSLVSNVNGHLEPMRELAEIAHRRGAVVYADIIQAAGAIPLDVRALGIDFAACSGYKWLLGPHGAGFFFARRELQGRELPDALFPGRARHNYSPWVAVADPQEPPYRFEPPRDARRYQPGHVSYLSYAALYETLGLLEKVGVAAALEHSLRLLARLQEGLKGSGFRSISSPVQRTPIATFLSEHPAERLRQALDSKRIAVTVSGQRLRVSPSFYNDEQDIDRLVEALRALGQVRQVR